MATRKSKLSKALKLLEVAKALISDKRKWCTGCLFQDDAGDESSCSNASKYCALGATYAQAGSDLMSASPTYIDEAISRLTAAADRLYPGLVVTDVNDRKGHAAVMKMYDMAIRSARGALARVSRR